MPRLSATGSGDSCVRLRMPETADRIVARRVGASLKHGVRRREAPQRGAHAIAYVCFKIRYTLRTCRAAAPEAVSVRRMN
jgi:hypothetical protein